MLPFVTQSFFWIAAACCLVAQLALIRSAIRSTTTVDRAKPAFAPRRSMEIVWTLIPAIALILLLSATWIRMTQPTADHGMPNMPAGSRMIEE